MVYHKVYVPNLLINKVNGHEEKYETKIKSLEKMHVVSGVSECMCASGVCKS